MSILSRWIEKEYKNKYTLMESKTTNSIYYSINDFVIRLSDHIAAHDRQNNLNIIMPVNSGTDYLVFKNDNLVPLIYGFHELKFIINWEINNYKLSQERTAVQENKKEFLENKLCNFNIDNPSERTISENWAIIVQHMIVPKFPQWSDLTKSTKNHIKDFFGNSNSKDINDCIEIIKYIYKYTKTYQRHTFSEILKHWYKFTYDGNKDKTIQYIVNELDRISKPTAPKPVGDEVKTHALRAKDYWGELCNYIYADFPIMKSFTKPTKEIIKRLFNDSSMVKYDECISMLKDIHDNYDDDYTLIDKLLAA